MGASVIMSVVAVGLAAGQLHPILPDRQTVEAALYVRLNGQCDGQIETETCVSHPRSARVRDVNCVAAGVLRSECSYKRRIHYICGSCKFKWHDARSTFVFETTGGWQVENDLDL